MLAAITGLREVYGIVTNGFNWSFYCLTHSAEGKAKAMWTRTSHTYEIKHELKDIVGIINWILEKVSLMLVYYDLHSALTLI